MAQQIPLPHDYFQRAYPPMPIVPLPPRQLQDCPAYGLPWSRPPLTEWLKLPENADERFTPDDIEMTSRGLALVRVYTKRCDLVGMLKTVTAAENRAYAWLTEQIGKIRLKALTDQLEAYRQKIGNEEFCKQVAADLKK